MPRPNRPAGCLRSRFRPALERLETRHAPAVLTVTNLSDHDPGSLRAELGLSQNGDTIQFADGLGGQITLTSGELLIARSVTIEGPGAGLLVVNGNRGSRVFEVAAGANVSLSGLTVIGGGVAGPLLGGGILNAGSLTVIDCALSGNSSGNGGGAIANTGTLTVTASFLSGNAADSFGGGIANGGTAVLTACTLSGNFTSGTGSTSGGGIYNSGRLTVTNCTLSGNAALNGVGGGIANAGTGTTTVTASTLSGNSASAISGIGGGIYTFGATLSLSDTIVARNTGLGGANSDIVGTVGTASASNLIGTGGSGGLIDGVNGNQVGVADPELGPLGYYGGPTPTIPLLPGSPAIGTGDPTLAYSDDQRGFRRGIAPSIGAAEYVPGNAASFRLSTPPAVTAGTSFSVTVTARDASGNVATGFTGPVVLRSTDPQAPDLGSYELTAADGGSHTFEVTLFSAPAQQLLALTHAFVGTTVLTVLPAAPAQLYLVVPDSAWVGVSAGTPLQVTAYLYDAYGNPVNSGTLHFSSSDGTAALPDDYPFTAADGGSHAFTLTLSAPGPVTVTASVVGSPAVSFELDLFVA